MPAPHQKSIQRPSFSQSPKRVGSGPCGPPISSGSGGLTAAARGAGCVDGAQPVCRSPASFAVNFAGAGGAVVETGMRASVPELSSTDHRATAEKKRLM
jgi:hypothetical protein